MKILCIIDHLGSGGAQRQMVNLACELKAKGHQVEMFIYCPAYDFFRPTIDQARLVVHEVEKNSGFSLKVLWRLMSLLRRTRFDGVISFLDSPNVYAELACLINPASTLIVSERSSHYCDKNALAAFCKRLFHVFSDAVIANSYSHAIWLCRYPWLKKKVKTIYNGYPIAMDKVPATHKLPHLSLLVIGRVGPEKNGLRLIEALSIFHQKHNYVPPVSWAGKQGISPADVAYCREMDEHLDRHPEVKTNWTWLGQRSDIPELLEQHYAIIHPSLYEGLPNVVCEALIAGRPVLASNVCDHPLLVEEGKQGFLFDPNDPHSIADAVESLVALSPDQWLQYSENARRYAEKKLDISRMADSYLQLLSHKDHG